MQTQQEVPQTAERPEYPFDLFAVVPADTGPVNPLVKRVEIPFDGVVTEVIVGFQTNNAFRSGVQFGKPEGDTIAPRGSTDEAYISLADSTLTFAPMVEIDADNDLEARFANLDPNNSVPISVIAVVQKREGA